MTAPSYILTTYSSKIHPLGTVCGYRNFAANKNGENEAFLRVILFGWAAVLHEFLL
jgi:hypothetical protein